MTFFKLNYLVVFCLMITSIHYSQELIITETDFNTSGCVTGININYTVNRSGRYYLSLLRESDGYERRIRLGRKSSGSYSYGALNIPSTTRIQLERRKLTFKTIDEKTVIHCSNDSDSDGVLNTNDRCAMVYGNLSNFGCPGNPDYILNDDSEIAAPGWGVHNINYARFSNNPIFFTRFEGGFINISKVLIDNIGDGNAQNAPVKTNFYISTDRTLSNDDFKFSSYAQLNTRINAGETNNYSTAPGVKLYGSSVGDNLSYGWYYLIIVIDEENTLDNSEITRSNNNYWIPLEYISHPRRETEETPGTLNPIRNSRLVTGNSYNVYVYDFMGTLIKTEKVNSKVRENEIITSLPFGNYIIRTPFGDKKISK